MYYVCIIIIQTSFIILDFGHDSIFLDNTYSVSRFIMFQGFSFYFYMIHMPSSSFYSKASVSACGSFNGSLPLTLSPYPPLPVPVYLSAGYLWTHVHTVLPSVSRPISYHQSLSPCLPFYLSPSYVPILTLVTFAFPFYAPVCMQLVLRISLLVFDCSLSLCLPILSLPQCPNLFLNFILSRHLSSVSLILSAVYIFSAGFCWGVFP
jgi:hypothetical protein